jgi:hypothetical protein
MSFLVIYAKIPMSFLNLYRRRRPQANYTLAIACAMSGILVANIWSFFLLLSFVDHGWLAARRRIAPLEFTGLLFGIFLAELVFVSYVRSKVSHDKEFASRVCTASPSISIWYAIASAVLLGSAAILVGVAN